eukprot:ctg_2608.g519
MAPATERAAEADDASVAADSDEHAEDAVAAAAAAADGSERAGAGAAAAASASSAAGWGAGSVGPGGRFVVNIPPGPLFALLLALLLAVNVASDAMGIGNAETVAAIPPRPPATACPRRLAAAGAACLALPAGLAMW